MLPGTTPGGGRTGGRLAEAVTAARCAARIAADQGRPLLLLVPTLCSALTADAVIAARVHREALLEAEVLLVAAGSGSLITVRRPARSHRLAEL
ncbi:hypothetical protein [Kocuria arenosa]|uniref:hypothetical protein n=1 Tax=Kocuria arenosa TaxID=3071446 RepID=UPI0034D755F8